MKKQIAFCVATMTTDFTEGMESFIEHSTEGLVPSKTFIQRNTPEDNLGVLGSYQRLYEHSTAEVLFYVHDDVICRETGWDARLTEEFDDDTVGVVGFGGAMRHGAPEIYKVPYQLQQLRRSHYRSNVDDAEVHGERFTGSCDMAVLDGFSLAVRRSVLDRAGGWPCATYPPHHVYDYWLCCMAHRLGYRVRLCGVRCHHLGGGTAVGAAYQAWAATTRWGSDSAMHEAGHRLIYDEFRDVLPYRVED